jgi:DNA polymerase-3 subunit gamma/tau
MSYTALARKWRPKKFAELVGQEHVRRALVNALESGRVHHAFLFTGTRGVGKTTIARIFAKCLNCEKGVTAEPCGECASCREIDAGRFVDLIEVDAASRTKVDDTRELLDNVQYAPTRGRYKVYLIDEVHMLSTHSFNALLKTLEEPPPHVKFLLATTDPQKLPVTVLSRCLQFNLKRLPVGQIADHMRLLLEKETVPFDAAGLRLVAQAADGSMRDGLSLLDQLIAFGGGKAGEEEARAMLGTISRDHVVRVADLLASMNVPELMRCARSLEEFSPDYAQVLDELAGLLVRVAMKQAIPDYEGDDLYAPELLERLAKTFVPEDVQLFYQTAITGRRDLSLAPDPRTGFEMTLLRMIAFRPGEEAQARAGGAPGQSGAAGLGGGGAGSSVGAAGMGAGAARSAAAGAGGPGSAGGGPAGSGAGGFGAALGGLGTASAAGGAGGLSGAGAGAVGAATGGAAGGAGGAAAARAAARAAAAGKSASGGTAGAATSGAAAGAGTAGGAATAGAAAGVRTSAGAATSVAAIAAGAGAAGATTPGAAVAGPGTAGAAAAGAGVDGAAAADTGTPGLGVSAAGPAGTGAALPTSDAWAALINQLDLTGAARQLAGHCVLIARQGGVVRLGLDPKHKFVRTGATEEKLAQALSRHFGETVRLEFEAPPAGSETPAQAEQRASAEELDSARRAFEADAGVQALRERFGATVLPDTVRPLK